MIICLYIECDSEANRVNLESLLYSHQYGFYDATPFEPILNKNHTLDEIECEYEGK